MARIVCEIEYIDLETDSGAVVPSVRATCTECGHETESFGESARSVRRCLVLMKEECLCGDENYFVAANGEHED